MLVSEALDSGGICPGNGLFERLHQDKNSYLRFVASMRASSKTLPKPGKQHTYNQSNLSYPLSGRLTVVDGYSQLLI